MHTMGEKTELEKMLAGDLYDASDKQLMDMRVKARGWMQRYNQTGYDKQGQEKLLQEIFGKRERTGYTTHHSFVYYGCHIEVGITSTQTLIAFFSIGSYIKMGNNVSWVPMYSYMEHIILSSLQKGSKDRNCFPIIIGNNAWIGGSLLLCMGLPLRRIQRLSGSCSYKGYSSQCARCGNPCRVIRKLSRNLDLGFWILDSVPWLWEGFAVSA
jgi:maltose O-acetyltransferase